MLRMNPLGVDLVGEMRARNEIAIGWGKARGLLDPTLDWHKFRQIVKDTYRRGDRTFNRAGVEASQLSRFIREMQVGDLVVVPHGAGFHVAEVTSDARLPP